MLLFAMNSLDARAVKLPLRRVLVLGLAPMPPADAPRPTEPALGIEGVIEGRHGGALHPCAGAAHRHPAAELAMGVPKRPRFCRIPAALRRLRRHGWACPGHPRLLFAERKTGMPAQGRAGQRRANPVSLSAAPVPATLS